MRTIKFRAWDIKNKKWICFFENTRYFINPTNGKLFDTKWGEYIDCILQQYTGLKDKNGTEVYEGDLVECKTPYGELVKEIVWDSERCGFFMKSSFVAYDSKNLYKLSKKKMLVVGNIYETPITS